MLDDLKDKEEQLLAVVSHELGHAALNHVLKREIFYTIEYIV